MTTFATTGLSDWSQLLEGSSPSITLSGEKGTCTSINGEKAYFYKRIPARPGEKITVSCLGRRVSGVDGSSGGIAIDYPVVGFAKTTQEFRSSDWQLYKASFVVPEDADIATDYVQATIGVWSSKDGTIEILNPRIEAADGGRGPFSRLWASALLNVSNGSISLNQSFANVGIKSIAYNSTDKSIDVTIDPVVTSNNLAPIIHVETTWDTNPEYTAKAAQYNRGTGTFKIKVYDTSATPPLSPVDLSTWVGYVWVSCIGV